MATVSRFETVNDFSYKVPICLGMKSLQPLVPSVPPGLFEDVEEENDVEGDEFLESNYSNMSSPTTKSNIRPDIQFTGKTTNSCDLSPFPMLQSFHLPALNAVPPLCPAPDSPFGDSFSSTGDVVPMEGILKYGEDHKDESEFLNVPTSFDEVGATTSADVNEYSNGKEMVSADVVSSIEAAFDDDRYKSGSGSDNFKAEVDAMLTALDDTLINRRGDIPPIGTRVAIERLAEKENPLEKEGRNTVIRGRFRDDHPFATAARLLGYKLVSPRYSHLSVSTENSDFRDGRDRMRLFLLDCNAVYRFLKGKDIKAPIIGGGPLDMFKLQQEVLLLGGLQNVVEKRAFRIVAQQLELPATCTSAAYVLKGTYERYLYHYEQLLVFGKWPANANETINMKHLVSASREREREQRNSRSSMFRVKRGRGGDDSGMTMDDSTSVLDDVSDKQRRWRFMTGNTESVCESEPPNGVSVAGAHALKEFMASNSTDPTGTWNFYCHLTGDDGGEFSLPRWALELPSSDAQEALIRTAMNVEKRGQGKVKVSRQYKTFKLVFSLTIPKIV